MEAITMFAVGVGFTGAFHLIFLTVDTLGKRKDKSKTRQATREDWYCFFQTADLLGDRFCQPTPREITASNNKQLEDQRRRQANRPRLHV